MNLDALEKSEVSKTLYGQIQWEEISRSGVFLQHRDVSPDRNLFSFLFHFVICSAPIT